MTPFSITFLSDNWEFAMDDPATMGEATENNAGFQIVYGQDSDNCLNG